MAKLTFLQVLKSNFRCATCKKKDCSVRYYPERKKFVYFGGSRYIIDCEKDKPNRIEKALKRPLP